MLCSTKAVRVLCLVVLGKGIGQIRLLQKFPQRFPDEAVNLLQRRSQFCNWPFSSIDPSVKTSLFFLAMASVGMHPAFLSKQS